MQMLWQNNNSVSSKRAIPLDARIRRTQIINPFNQHAT